MMTTSLPMASLTFLNQNLKINSTPETMSNKTNSSSGEIPDVGLSCFTMIFGTISNLTALGILARSRARFRRQSKAPFLLLTVALLLADLGGHLILGAFVLYLHIISSKLTPNFCDIFGTSMVFFGLCPLLLGCAMAVERCIAITKPFFHISMITVGHVKRVVLFLTSIPLVLAVLPLFSIGSYQIQIPNTWCFLDLQGNQPTDRILALTFSGLGLTALILSLFCNILSGLALLQARTKSKNSTTNPTARCDRRPSSASASSTYCSLDVEMMAQLAAITVVSCVCWGPFLIHILMSQLNNTSENVKDRLILLFLRLASWNQILDPWVYILLRRTVLLSVCCGHSQGFTGSEYSSYRDYRRRDSSLP